MGLDLGNCLQAGHFKSMQLPDVDKQLYLGDLDPVLRRRCNRGNTTQKRARTHPPLGAQCVPAASLLTPSTGATPPPLPRPSTICAGAGTGLGAEAFGGVGQDGSARVPSDAW